MRLDYSPWRQNTPTKVMQAKYCTLDGKQFLNIGVTAAFENDNETVREFRSIAEKFGQGLELGAFIIDLECTENGTIDTIAVSRDAYENITGEMALNEASYLLMQKDI